MVVQCPSCQSKFRIADEKVTDKGVRVRCTSCKNVFQARRPGSAAEAAAAPGTTLDLTSLAASPVGKAAPRPPAAVRPASSPRPSARTADSAARRLDADDLFGMAELTGDAPLSPLSLPAAVTKPVARQETALGDLDLEFTAGDARAAAAPLPPPPPQEDDARQSEPEKDEGAAEAAAKGTSGAPAAQEDSFGLDLDLGQPRSPPAVPAKTPVPAEPA